MVILLAGENDLTYSSLENCPSQFVQAKNEFRSYTQLGDLGPKIIVGDSQSFISTRSPCENWGSISLVWLRETPLCDAQSLDKAV